MALPLYTLLYGQPDIFSAAEALTLCPKGVKGAELDARLRVAQTMSDLRHGRPLTYPDTADTLERLRNLCRDALSPGNLVQVYTADELRHRYEALEAEQGPAAWSRLTLLLGRIRRETAGRYAHYEACRMRVSDRHQQEQYVAHSQECLRQTGESFTSIYQLK